MKTLIFFIILFAMAPMSNATIGEANELNMTSQIEDKKLAGMIRSTIAFERRLYDAKVKVDVRASKVTFYGQVNNQQEHDLLIEIVNQTAGKALVVLTSQLHIVNRVANRNL